MLILIRAVASYHDSRSSPHWRPLAYSSSSSSWVWSRASCQRWSGTTPLSQTSRVSWNLKISPADGGDLVVLNTLNVARAKAAQERRPRAGRRKAVALVDSRWAQDVSTSFLLLNQYVFQSGDIKTEGEDDWDATTHQTPAAATSTTATAYSDTTSSVRRRSSRAPEMVYFDT